MQDKNIISKKRKKKFSKWCYNNWLVIYKKKKLDCYLKHDSKINSREAKNLDINKNALVKQIETFVT